MKAQNRLRLARLSAVSRRVYPHGDTFEPLAARPSFRVSIFLYLFLSFILFDHLHIERSIIPDVCNDLDTLPTSASCSPLDCSVH